MKAENKWWETAVFYQIYMPSFEEEGFRGMCKRIPYLKKLGAGGVWLTPFYPSPRVDNGYDISDYLNVDESYGSLSDFDAFVRTAHEAGIKVIADMVLNHTSSRHPWFQDSIHNRNGKGDFYIWEKEIPNNWESFFGGSAYEWNEERGAFYYHSFAKEQPDLNFRNPDVTEAVLAVLDFWLEKGIDGFRLDVINNLSTSDDMRDNPEDEKGCQQHLYDVNQNGIETVLQKIRKKAEAFPDRDIFLVGEISSDKLPLIRRYAGGELLHTTFNFNLGSRERFLPEEVAEELAEMTKLYEDCLPTLFFGSHDMRRAASRFEMKEDQLRTLFLLQMTCRGIPFLYNGEELGMKDFVAASLSQVKDCQALIAYEEALLEGKSEEQAFCELLKNSRDYSRGRMDWEEAKRQDGEESSLLEACRRIIAFRNENPVLQTGCMSAPACRNGVISYERYDNNTRFFICLNFSGEGTVPEIENAQLRFDTSASGCNSCEKVAPFSGAVFEIR